MTNASSSFLGDVGVAEYSAEEENVLCLVSWGGLGPPSWELDRRWKFSRAYVKKSAGRPHVGGANLEHNL